MKNKIKNKYIISIVILNVILFGQDNIINQIAPGGKFIVRDTELNEFLVVENDEIIIKGELKLETLEYGKKLENIVVWDNHEKTLKILPNGFTKLSPNIPSYDTEKWHNFDNKLPDDNSLLTNSTVQSTSSVRWNKFITDYGYVMIGPANDYFAHIYSDNKMFLFNNDIRVKSGRIGSQQSDLELRTNNSTRIFADIESGYVGIGTTNPRTNLEVAGQVQITGGEPGIGKVLTSDASGLASWEEMSSTNTDTLWTKSEDNIYRNIGNIGIGTINPSEKLTVVGIIESSTGGYKFPDGTIQTTASNEIGGNGDSHSLNSADDSIEDALYVSNNGNVGVGTTSPSGIMELNSVTGALIVPRMSTSQRDDLPTVNGSIIYNIDTNEFNFLENDNWSAL